MSKFDFVIVGAGVHGLATAYHLARSGAASVCVIEAETVASGASGGFGQRGVRANRRDLRELPLMREANEIWPTLHDELGAPTGYHRSGGVYLIDGPAVSGFKGIDAAETYARVQSALGVPTELWGRSRVESEYPGVSSAVHGAAYVPSDGVASHQATTFAFAQAAKRLGVTIVERTRVRSIEAGSDGRVSAVTTDDDRRFGVNRELVLAANGGVRALVRDAIGADVPTWTIYPQAARLRSRSVPAIPMLTGHETRPLSVKMLGDEVMLSGGWRGRLGINGPEVVAERLEGNIAVLQSVFPYLHDLELIEADVSRAESASVDQIPIIGRYGPNLYVATGWSGHGWAIAPAVSRHIAEALISASEPPELAAFDPGRFTLSTRTNN